MFNRRTKETDPWNFFEKFNKHQSVNIACVYETWAVYFQIVTDVS